MAKKTSKKKLQGYDGLTPEDLVGAIIELASAVKSQGEKIARLERKEAQREVDGHIREGRVPRGQRAAFVELALANRKAFRELLAKPEG